MEKIIGEATAVAMGKVIEKFIDYIIKEHVKKHRLHIPMSRGLSKESRSIVIEYIGLLDDGVPASNEADLLRGFLRDARLEILPLDLSKLNGFEDFKKLVYVTWKAATLDIVYSDDAYWVIAGSVERYRDLLGPPDIEDLDAFIEEMEEVEKEAEEMLGASSDLIYMISYNILPITKKGTEKTYEVINKLHWTIDSRLGVRATIKMKIYGRAPKKIPGDVNIYNMDDHYVIVAYDPLTLKEILENL